MKKLVIMLLVLCLCACSTPTNNNQDDPIVDISEPTFEEKDIFTTACDIKKISYEANYSILECSFYNNSDQDVMIDNVELQFKMDTRSNIVNPIENKLLKAKEMTVLEFLYYGNESKSVENKNIDASNIINSYYYYNPIDGIGNNVNTLNRTFESNIYPLDKYYQIVDVNLLPMIPNFGYTIFAFKNNGEWSFDMLRGIEHEECESTYFEEYGYISDFADNYVNRLFYKDDNYLAFIVQKDKSITEKESKYFEAIFNDLKLTYVYSDDTNGVNNIRNKYMKEGHLKLVPKGYVTEHQWKIDKCMETACIYTDVNYEDEPVNNYQFSNNELENVKENTYTIDEIADFMKKNSSLYFYMRGLDVELNEKDASELETLFKKNTKIEIKIQGTPPIIPIGAAKPVIYLYPTTDTMVDVSLNYGGTLTTTYPKYNNGWKVLAKSDGTLINQSDKHEYSYLFWEGGDNLDYDMSNGFVVKREDSIAFLQEKLAYLGLLPKEYNEFIVYWLPLLEKNPYNLISFQTDIYTENAKLTISPKPDSMQRVFMTYKALDEEIKVEEQILEPFTRHGFSVIEWGGTQVYK